MYTSIPRKVRGRWRTTAVEAEFEAHVGRAGMIYYFIRYLLLKISPPQYSRMTFQDTPLDTPLPVDNRFTISSDLSVTVRCGTVQTILIKSTIDCIMNF
jgi:hypothetical protein